MAASPRWTDAQVRLLLKTVKSSPTAKEAFAVVAEQLGKTPGTVQQKYYAVKRGKGKRRKANIATPKSSVRTSAKASGSSSSQVSINTAVSSMSNVELSQLVEHATRELVKRMTTLETNIKQLLR